MTPIEPGVVSIVTIGALRWELGLEYAVCAVAAAQRRGLDLRYDIIGAGPERERVVYTAVDLGAEGIVRVLDPGDDIADHFARADIFLWPHLFDVSSAAVDAAVRSETQIVSTVQVGAEPAVATRDMDELAKALARAATRAPASSRRKERLGSDVAGAILREARCG